MDNQMEVYEDTVVKSNKKKWIGSTICILIALLSFFVLTEVFTSPKIYGGVFKTLDDLQKRAIELTSMSTIFATGAAAIPGEAMSPIANKLADMSGYMVIIYVVIILEKYLVTLAAYVTFKIILPIGCLLLVIGNCLKSVWKEFFYRLSIKLILSGILLCFLVPTSTWVTNWINNTYEISSNITSNLENEKEEIEEEKDDDQISGKNSEEGKNEKFSISSVINNFSDKVSEVVKAAGDVTSAKIEDVQNALNQMIEGIAVMLVTTCVIPILVMLAFIWILKFLTGLNLPTLTIQSVPKASKIVKKKKERKSKIEEKLEEQF